MVGNLGGCYGAGHQVQFLHSHQNLKHSNLLEDSLEDSDRIFRSAAVPDRTGRGTGMLYFYIKALDGSSIMCEFLYSVHLLSLV